MIPPIMGERVRRTREKVMGLGLGLLFLEVERMRVEGVGGWLVWGLFWVRSVLLMNLMMFCHSLSLEGRPKKEDNFR